MARDTLQRLRGAMKAASPLGGLVDDETDLELCIVAPAHPWLVGWLDAALGLTPGDAVMITLPGGPQRDAGGSLDPGVVRAVAAACFRHGCREVLLLALPSAMSPQDSAALVEAFRSRGVDRDAIPSADLRGYLGLLDDPQGWLPRAAGELRSAAVIPDDVRVHAAILDPRTGKLHLLDVGEAPDPARERTPDPLGLGGRGPVSLAEASLPPHQQRPELIAAHERAIEPPRHVANPKDFDPGSIELAPEILSESVSGALLGTPLEESGAVWADSLRPAEVPAPRPAARAPAPRPPPAQKRQSPAPRPPPAPRRSPSPQKRIDLEAHVVEVGGHRMSSEVAHALRVVRQFYLTNFDDRERAQMLSAATEALDAGLGVEVGLKVIIQPVIRLGPVRYQVLNELLAVKGALGQLPAAVASLLLRAVLA
ncbi:MAG: hypothetical protein P1V51_20865 [Deltaproteobacteria bacterium]|nr:hypothetical protein [Deltaproteobacteria bacterium]